MRSEIKSKRYLGKTWLWFRPQGDLDMATAEEFKTQLQEAMTASGSRNLWLDLSCVGFIDSSGLGVLLGRYRALQPLAGRIVISKANEQVFRLLTASGLHHIMEIDKPPTLHYQEEGI